MKIVVTGGLGFIGQNFASHVRSRRNDYELIAIDWFEGASEKEEALFDHVHRGCFAGDEAMKFYEGADVVVHLAAYTTVQESITDPIATFENNVVKTQAVLEHLRKHAQDVMFVFASTGGAIVGDCDGAINENTAARPVSPYGASKLAVEGLLSAYHGSYGMKTASLRFSNVYGPNSYRKGSVVSAFCKMMINENKLQINGDGLQTRDYIYVDDISEAIYQVVLKGGQNVFQLGTGEETSILDMVNIFRELGVEKNPSVVNSPELPGEVRRNRSDISRIRNELGFEPKWSLKDGIRATFDWYQSQV